MHRTPSPPRGPHRPQGTFARLQAEIAHEKAEAAPVAGLGSRDATAPPNHSTTMEDLIAAQISVTGGRPLSISNAPSLGIFQVNPRRGEYWLVEVEGQENWPGVICDEELVVHRDFLAQNRRPITAARQDGHWLPNYRPQRDRAGTRTFPVLYMKKKLEFHWVPRRRLLTRLDVHAASQVLSGINEGTHVELAQAYMNVRKNHDLGYWKSEIVMNKLSEEDESGGPSTSYSCSGDESPLKSSRGPKRKCSDGGPAYPHAIETDDCEDDDESHLFAKEPKVKQEPDVSAVEIRAKRQKTSISAKEWTPSTTTHMPSQKITDDEVRIYVGNPHQEFVVPKVRLEQSDLLQSLIKYEKGEAYIMCPLLSGMDPLGFQSVAEYLRLGEYDPSLLYEGSDQARLDKVNTRRRRTQIMEQFGELFQMGKHLQLSGLQDLVVRKFRVLTPQASNHNFLTAACHFYRDGWPSNLDLHDFVVAYFAQEHFQIWASQSNRYLEFCVEQGPLEIEIQRKRIANWDEEIAKAKAKEAEQKDDVL